jgi:hypothetical protein
MGSIGISDTTPVDSTCHPDEMRIAGLISPQPWSNDL